MTSNETDDGLRFRFRATSLPKSPSAERFVMSRREQHFDDDAQINDDDDDDENNVVLATYVEPPELPTKTTHKVFGALFISLLSFLSDETRLLLPTYRHSRVHIYIHIFIFDVTQNTDTTTSLLLPSFSTLFIATDD